MKTCGRCGADVPGAEAMAVEALTVAGTRICSVLCQDCGRVLAAGKFPGVSMGSDGKLEAVPSVPADANTCAPRFDPALSLASFMGRDASYWMALDAHAKSMRYEGLVEEIAQLKLQVQAVAADKRLEFRKCPACGAETPSMQHAVKAVGEFGYNVGPTQNRPYLTAEQRKAYDEDRYDPSELQGEIPPVLPDPPRNLTRTEQRRRIEMDDLRDDVNTCSPKSSCCPDCDEFEAEMAAEMERDRSRKSEREDRLREALSAYAHEAWMQIAAANLPYLIYALAQAGHAIDTCECKGCTRVRKHRSLMVPYAHLSEEEKASDRVQADKILAILRGEKA